MIDKPPSHLAHDALFNGAPVNSKLILSTLSDALLLFTGFYSTPIQIKSCCWEFICLFADLLQKNNLE
jgi:hypothetical protein